MKTKFLTRSPGQTKKIAESLAKKISKSSPGKRALTIGLIGDLGGGKTTFLQGFARGLGVKQKILSPTFIIMKKFPISNFQFLNFYHIDCYRVTKPKEILDLGFKEIIADPGNIVAVEWADKIMDILPRNAIILKFDHIDSSKRRIECTLKK